jgi:hypothetical protein
VCVCVWARAWCSRGVSRGPDMLFGCCTHYAIRAIDNPVSYCALHQGVVRVRGVPVRQRRRAGTQRVCGRGAGVWPHSLATLNSCKVSSPRGHTGRKACHAIERTDVRVPCCRPAVPTQLLPRAHRVSALTRRRCTPVPQSLGAGALLVNPWNISDMAAAIHDALSMSEDERRERHRQNYMHVQVLGVGFQRCEMGGVCALPVAACCCLLLPQHVPVSAYDTAHAHSCPGRCPYTGCARRRTRRSTGPTPS